MRPLRLLDSPSVALTTIVSGSYQCRSDDTAVWPNMNERVNYVYISLDVTSTDLVRNVANSVKARQLTGNLLENQGSRIPSPDDSLRRGDNNVRDHRVASRSFYVDEDGNRVREDTGSDDDSSDITSESSLESRDINPFVNSDELQGKIAHLERELANVKERLNQTKTELALEQSRRPTLYDDYYFLEQP